MDLSNDAMVHIKKDGIEYLQFRKLLEFENLIHCYTLRTNDVNFKSDSINYDESITKISKALNINKDNIVKPIQKHTDCIKNVDSVLEKFENVDGLITNKSNINCMLSFADCTPILLYDQVNKVIGNIHSGWRGTVQKIGQKAVLKMMKDYNSKPENIIACIGPCIGKCHFEVDSDVKEIFENTFGYFNRNYDIIEKQKEIIEGKEKYHIDTTLVNRLMLEECGLKPKNIIESNICTVCNSTMMHSYRADKEKSGRNVAILGKL